MDHPTGLLLTASAVTPDQVSAALAEQGGPAWDRTAYRLLTGVDPRSLALGTPAAGEGVGISLASSGWWLRPIDELADHLSTVTGHSVLAVTEHPEAASSAYHLATPNDAPVRRVRRDRPRGWAEGVALLSGGAALADRDVAALRRVALPIHGNDPSGADLPAMSCLRFLPELRSEWPALLEQRGAALCLGLPWCPDVAPVAAPPMPPRMRVISLQSPVRLPGPPRWARAIRREAIHTARTVVEGDGWVCLAPSADGQPAPYGAAVRILQFAPLPDGSWIGVLHPRAAVRIQGMADGFAEIEPVPDEPANPAELGVARLSLVDALERSTQRPGWSQAELDESADPAALIAHQVHLSPEACQRYLAARDAAERAAVLAQSLD